MSFIWTDDDEDAYLPPMTGRVLVELVGFALVSVVALALVVLLAVSSGGYA